MKLLIKEQENQEENNMNEMTIAELIEQQLREQNFPIRDVRRSQKNNWLINMIVTLFKKHKAILKGEDLNKLSVNKIISKIEAYFKALMKRRKLNKELCLRFIYKNNHTRKFEDLALMLVLGFPLLYAFKRIINSRKKVGEKFDIEPDYHGGISYIEPSDFDVMPVQIDDQEIRTIYDNIRNSKYPGDIVSEQINFYKPSYSKEEINKKKENLKKIFK